MNKKIVYGGFIISSFIIFLIVKKIMQKNSIDTAGGKKRPFNENDAKEAILYIAEKYGVNTARLVEQIMRLETGHFKRGQYRLTGSAGMEAGKWQGLPSNVAYIEMKDNHDGHIGKFIVWDTVKDFAEYLTKYIQRYNGNYARWNTTNETAQNVYRSKVESIKPRFV